MKPMDEVIETFARERRQIAASIREIAYDCRSADPTRENMDAIAGGLDSFALILERSAMSLLEEHDAR